MVQPNNYFFTNDDKSLVLNKIYSWFGLNNDQVIEANKMLQKIIQARLLTNLIRLTKNKEEVPKEIERIVQGKEAEKINVTELLMAIEFEYYTLIEEVVSSLNQQELTSLQQILEER